MRAPAIDAVRSVASDANFVLLELAGEDDMRVADALAREGILVRAGTEFGLPGYVRVTTAGEALMADVADRLAALATPARAPASSDCPPAHPKGRRNLNL